MNAKDGLCSAGQSPIDGNALESYTAFPRESASRCRGRMDTPEAGINSRELERASPWLTKKTICSIQRRSKPCCDLQAMVPLLCRPEMLSPGLRELAALPEVVEPPHKSCWGQMRSKRCSARREAATSGMNPDRQVLRLKICCGGLRQESPPQSLRNQNPHALLPRCWQVQSPFNSNSSSR